MLKLHSRAVLNVSSSGWRKHEHNFPASAGFKRSQVPYQLRLLGGWFGFGPNEAGVGRQRVADNHMMRGSGREILDANVIFQFLAGGGAGGHAHADGDDRSRRIFSIDLGRGDRHGTSRCQNRWLRGGDNIDLARLSQGRLPRLWRLLNELRGPRG